MKTTPANTRLISRLRASLLTLAALLVGAGLFILTGCDGLSGPDEPGESAAISAPSGVASNATTGAEMQITSSSDSQAEPAISGDNIVWTQRRGRFTDYDIYSYNIAASTTTQITDYPSIQWAPDVSDNYVVWSDNRNGNYDIYLYDLTTGDETQITTNTANQEQPAISGNYVVWSDLRNGRHLYLYDIAAGTETQVTTGSNGDAYPGISGNHVVWEEFTGSTWYISLYDLSTSTKTQIATNTGRFPAISGNYIVWEDRRNGNRDIYLYDLTTGDETQITTNTAEQRWPAISGNYVVWQDYRNGNPDIYLYDLTTGDETQITTNTAEQRWPAISGNYVVWQDYRNGNPDIYAYDLSFTANQAPTADAGGPYSGDEGSSITFDGSASSDADSDPLSYEWDFDYDGSTFVAEAGATSATPSFTYADNGTFTAAVRVSDGTDSDIATATVTIDNAAPTVDAITGLPTDPVPVGTEVTLTASFSDAGTLDTHTGEIDWDNSTTNADISESGGSGTASGSYTYSEAGVYRVKVTVTDKDSDSGFLTYEYVVVYDPEAGFVTGGGWIDSPQGAYADDPSLTGKASFGFVSRYKKGANVPSGNTQFEFKAGDLKFHSTAYDWLVVAGAKGKFKGSGTIGGSGDYGFMLTATDSKVNGGGSEDTFRIKIWVKATDEVVYDNQMGEDDDSGAGTALGGGNIAIHSK